MQCSNQSMTMIRLHTCLSWDMFEVDLSFDAVAPVIIREENGNVDDGDDDNELLSEQEAEGT